MTINTVLNRLHDLVNKRAELFKNDEAIKASLVMPFLSALGHDPFNPDMVIAGYQNDEGRADFATIDEDGSPQILVCITSDPSDLESEKAASAISLLSDAGDIALFTDGRRYHFHGVEPSRSIIAEPFMAFDLKRRPVDSDILLPLTRDGYDLQAAVEAGQLTKQVSAYDVLISNLEDHNSEIFQVVARQTSASGDITDEVREETAEAFDRVLKILSGQIEIQSQSSDVPEAPVAAPAQPEDDGRVMTGDEKAAYLQVCEIAGKYIDPSRIYARPAQTYLAVILDDNNRRTICRLYFLASSSRYIGTFVAKAETKQKIASYLDVARFENELRDRLKELDEGAFALRASELEKEQQENVEEASQATEAAEETSEEKLINNAQPEAEEDESQKDEFLSDEQNGEDKDDASGDEKEAQQSDHSDQPEMQAGPKMNDEQRSSFFRELEDDRDDENDDVPF